LFRPYTVEASGVKDRASFFCRRAASFLATISEGLTICPFAYYIAGGITLPVFNFHAVGWMSSPGFRASLSGCMSAPFSTLPPRLSPTKVLFTHSMCGVQSQLCASVSWKLSRYRNQSSDIKNGSPLRLSVGAGCQSCTARAITSFPLNCIGSYCIRTRPQRVPGRSTYTVPSG